MNMRKTVIATRGSKLALVQAEMVRAALIAAGVNDTSILTVSTKGDRDRTSPLGSIGGKGLFVKEIEAVLAGGEGDIAVHSAKDLPYELMEGMTIGAVLVAADPRDCLISVRGRELPKAPVIGTGSRRRMLECGKHFPNAVFKEIRGNVDTRLRKLVEGEYDAIILAKAGLDRLGSDLSDFDVHIFSTQDFIPAPCQGIIAVECRADDEEMLSILKKVNDERTRRRFEIERRIFAGTQADCSVAVGVHAVMPCDEDGGKCRVSAAFEGRRVELEFESAGTDEIVDKITRCLLDD